MRLRREGDRARRNVDPDRTWLARCALRSRVGIRNGVRADRQIRGARADGSAGRQIAHEDAPVTGAALLELRALGRADPVDRLLQRDAQRAQASWCYGHSVGIRRDSRAAVAPAARGRDCRTCQGRADQYGGSNNPPTGTVTAAGAIQIAVHEHLPLVQAGRRFPFRGYRLSVTILRTKVPRSSRILTNSLR